jgi:AcrR family transcriptional regulator
MLYIRILVIVSRSKRDRPVAGATARVGRLRAEVRAAKRRALLDAAARVLVARGREGFTIRDVAEEAGASTMVIYTQFGGRDGLLEALCRDGLDRLAESLERGRHADDRQPIAALRSLAARYRRFALADPAYYHAMAIALRPGRWVRDSRAHQILVRAVARAVELGDLPSLAPTVIADALWALVHGLLVLELGGHFPSDAAAQRCFVVAGTAMLGGFRLGLPGP